MPRVALIVNPFASAVDEHRIKLVEGALARAADVGTHLTERRGHATEIAQRSHAGRPGDVAFAGTLLKFIAEQRGRFDPVLEIDGVGRAAFVLVANADPYTYLGSIAVHVAPDATHEAGLYAVAPTRVRPRHIPQLFRYVVTGRRRPRSV